MIVRLKRHDVYSLKEEAKKAHPVEACAMLFGELVQNEAIVRKVVLVPNKLQSPVKFEIDPEMVVRTFIEMERIGFDFIGLFHSHPAPATPSLIDLKFMELWGETVWLILSSTDDNLAAYQMKDGKLREICIICEEP